MENLLSSLNPNQRAAVEYVDGAQLVIAGAGSGKTRVLTYKIAYLLSRGMNPWNILALTFTNKAAREMKDRIAQLVGPDQARYLNMGTFHSIFLRILRVEAETIGLAPNFTIYDDSDSRGLVGSIIKEMQLDDKVYKPSAVLSRIGMAKNSLITPDAYIADAQLRDRDLRSKMPRIGDIYRIYAQRCLNANAVDFDDMLLFTYILFRNHPEVCRKYAERFAYVLVDEYQDTNYAQQCIVTLLTHEHGRICVVGDDAQSIYAFRGANIDNILNFQRLYQGAKLFKLEQNYRSTQNIVGAANCLIRHNRRQIEKTVFSENPEGDKITLNIAYSDKEEAAIVANEIRRLHNREHVPYGGFAILYRTNAQSRIFEDELRRLGTPYRIYGGMSFYQRKEIKDIIAYFRLVANPNDEEALKRIINYPKRGIGATSVDKLIAAARHYDKSLWTVVSSPTTFAPEVSAAAARRIVAFHDMMQIYIDQRKQIDAYALGRQIIEQTGLAAEIFAGGDDDALDRRENVEEFISGLHDFVDSKREEDHADEVYIDRFLQEVALVTDADRDADKDENSLVSLMTIHASKGLEFDTVFVVGVEENLFPSLRACEFPRELEEERRLFYVAITRAEKRCLLSCAKSRYQYGNMQFNEPSRFLREIDPQWMNVNGRLASNRSRFGGNESGSRPFGDNDFSRTPFGETNSIRNRYEDNRVGFERSGRRVVPESPIPDLARFRRLGGQRNTPVASEVAKANPSIGSSKPGISVGARIEHQRFGLGRVISVEGKGENEKATVEFDNAGVKTLLLKFARFNVVG